jgi:hypothetical protein
LWIAFANTYGDPYGNGGYIGNAYGNRDSYGNGDCIGNAYGDRNGNGNGDCIGNAYGNRYRGAEVYADPQAASYTAASALRPALAHVSSGTRVNARVPVLPTKKKLAHGRIPV